MNGLNGSIAFWSAITGFKKVLKRYEHVLRTFHMLRTCVIKFLLVKIMKTNLISHENHKIAMKTRKSAKNSKNMLHQQTLPHDKIQFYSL